MISAIKKLKPGQKIVIESVEAKANDNKGSTVKLPGATIIIE